MWEGRAVQLLLVEDSPFDARVITQHLQAAAAEPYELRHVGRLDLALSELTGGDVDCVLLDLGLPDSSGLDGVATLLATHPDTALVVLSATDEQLMGAAAVQAGAQDYLTKGELDGRQLWRAIRYAHERRKSQRLLRHAALYDSLTGLANRTLFLDRLALALARLERRGGHVAVFYLDLDGFKWVNDSLGHEAGDLVVTHVGERLRDALRPYDTAARIGGDEFILLTEGPDDDEDAALRLAERLRETLKAPIRAMGSEVRVSASIGIVTTRDASTPPSALIRDADVAMYAAKALGKNRWALFDDTMRRQAQRRLDLLAGVHRALDRRSFTVLYQPIVALDTRQVRGWEAVLPWFHADGAAVPPRELQSVLEDHGLVAPVGQLVLESALAWLAQHPADEPAPFISTNVSMVQLAQPDVVRRIKQAVAAAGLRPQQVCLELSENVLAAADREVRARLDELKQWGVRLVMDEYGTASSTLAHLRELPVDSLKLDRSFVSVLTDSEPDRRIVHAVVAMGQSLGIDVIADGVESDAQADVLRELGCRYAQGPLFGLPSTAGVLTGSGVS